MADVNNTLVKKKLDEKYGSATLRIKPSSDGYDGVVIVDGKVSEKLHDEDFDRLRARLRNLAGTLHPNYWGIDGAISRFCHYFPSGFADPKYVEAERNYKLKAAAKLAAILPLDRALDATADDARAIKPVFGTNMLHVSEAARISAVLAGPAGSAYVRAAARFTKGDHAAGLKAMHTAILPEGAATWPMVTYLSNLWDLQNQMFLKPEVTKDFAERIGHSFANDYEPQLSADVYLSLLDLVATTERDITVLEPADRIDVQSFIWVVGRYQDGQ